MTMITILTGILLIALLGFFMEKAFREIINKKVEKFNAEQKEKKDDKKSDEVNIAKINNNRERPE